jgi:taurine--2-oxoglutarate transaminase
VQLGAVGMRRGIADKFNDKVFTGLTTTAIRFCARRWRRFRTTRTTSYRERKLGVVMKELHAGSRKYRRSARRVDRPVRADRAGARQGEEDAARAVQRHVGRDAGAGEVLPSGRVYTFVRWHTFFTNPPLCITEAQLREAFAIIDRGLEITDRAYRRAPFWGARSSPC